MLRYFGWHVQQNPNADPMVAIHSPGMCGGGSNPPSWEKRCHEERKNEKEKQMRYGKQYGLKNGIDSET